LQAIDFEQSPYADTRRTIEEEVVTSQFFTASHQPETAPTV
jgi:hypothetical protein